MWEIYSPLPIVTAIPMYGLSNRLRGIASGQILARSLGYGFNVFWNIVPHMPAHFLDLFENPSLVFLAEPPNGPEVFLTTKGGSGPWLQRRIPNAGCFGVGVEATADLSHIPPEPLMLGTFHNLRPIEMTDEEFMRQKRAFLASLRPLPHIQADIDAVTSEFVPHMVGVHMRATNLAWHWKGREFPSRLLYFSQMNACLREIPDTGFFVASDTDEGLEATVERFGDRIISTRQVLKRDLGERETIEGQGDAVVDLFCLARTSKLIGTHRSSFTYEAAALGDIPLVEIAGKRENDWQMPGSVLISEPDEPIGGTDDVP